MGRGVVVGARHLCHCMHPSQPCHGDRDLPALWGLAATRTAQEKPAAPTVPKEAFRWRGRLSAGASPCSHFPWARSPTGPMDQQSVGLLPELCLLLLPPP